MPPELACGKNEFRKASAVVALGLWLSACAPFGRTAPEEQDFSSVRDVSVSVTLAGQLVPSPTTVVGRSLFISVSYAAGPDECRLEKAVKVTLNGVELAREGEGTAQYDWDSFRACSATVFTAARTPALVAAPPAESDDRARTGVIEISNGKRSATLEIPSLLDERKFSVFGPREGVLVPGERAIISWSNANGLLDIGPESVGWGLKLINGWDDQTSTAKAPAVTLLEEDIIFGENRMEFDVPSLAIGKGYVLVQGRFSLNVTRCEGVDTCTADILLGAGIPKEVVISAQ